MKVGAVRFDEILDGLSNTIFVGEKHVHIALFGEGPLDCSVYNGDYYKCSTRSGGPGNPIADSPSSFLTGFGSYHPDLCQFVLGDGSVRTIANDINPTTLGLLTNIADGKHVPEY